MRTSTLALFAFGCAADLDAAPADLPDTGPLPRAATAGSAPQHASGLLALVAADRRQFASAGPARFTASPRFGLTAELTTHGLRASARDDSVALTTVAYGNVDVGGAEPELGDCAHGDEQVDAACVRQVQLDHGALTEWWVSRAEGLEHGWTLHAPPAEGPVSITVALSDGEVLDVDNDGAGASLLGSQGGLWRYDGLVAWDNDGVGLPARLVDEGTHLMVEVDATGAQWPVTVDPVLSTETKLTASDGAPADYYGYAVSGAGDLNGDGYDDVVVGAPYDGDNGRDSGSAYVYYGSATGIDRASEDKLTASDGAPSDKFGYDVSGAGDLDGDGYDDLVVGAVGSDDNGSASGSAYVYYGSATGIDGASVAKLTASDGAADDDYGSSVSGAGDLNGDGFDDLVVGASADDDKASDSGSAYIYFGSATGIDIGAEVKLTASDAAADNSFGGSVSGAGDLDGDGYDDLVVGAHGSDNNTGSTYVYLGSGAGIRNNSEDKLTASDGAAGELFGYSVTGAGDTDGDGYDDLVVGAPGHHVNGLYSGSAYVYFGSASGINGASEARLTPSDGAAGDRFGFAVSAAGKLDGGEDGYGDLVVGAWNDGDNGTASGSAYVYYGSAAGIDGASEDKLTPSDGTSAEYYGYAVSGAGDLDGDGDDDLVVGASRGQDGGFSNGSAYVYEGGCRDVDGDGYGCEADCDNNDANTNPDAAEVCDEIDNDCDGTVDDDAAVDAATWYADADDDGYGDAASSSTSCVQPDGTSADATDCDDTDAASFPGAAEVEDDGVDQDCDGEDALAEVDESGAEAKSGCGGCASASGPSNAVGLWLLLGLLGVRRHRRRDVPSGS
jgi:MYXO-CTERM domain-containing protein